MTLNSPWIEAGQGALVALVVPRRSGKAWEKPWKNGTKTWDLIVKPCFMSCYFPRFFLVSGGVSELFFTVQPLMAECHRPCWGTSN